MKTFKVWYQHYPGIGGGYLQKAGVKAESAKEALLKVCPWLKKRVSEVYNYSKVDEAHIDTTRRVWHSEME